MRDRLIDEAVSALLLRIGGNGPALPIDRLTRLAELDEEIALADARFIERAEQIVAATAQRPLTLAQARAMLRPGEALVIHNIAPTALVATCVDPHGEHRAVQPLSAALGADQTLVTAAVHAAHAPAAALDAGFPGESAHRLFAALFGGVAACLEGKRHVLLATDPDLFGLPFQALLAEPPPRPYRHRDAAWLPRRFALSLLPSASGLQQLRASGPSSARERFLGVGNPDFDGDGDAQVQIALRSAFQRRGLGNPDAVRSLPRLPQTARELDAIAAALGTPAGHLLLGPDASERGVRSQSLDAFRVISFATHALVAGELDGVAEPALALTPGGDANPRNDGLLTATEIANLTLDANLVVLSACNTAAPDGRVGGRGLSGLANAFFFAGARSLAVTQWPVFSEAAQQLGAGLVTQAVADRQGVAEGLRHTVLRYVDDAAPDHLAHPRFWAAFVIAGDGAVDPLAGQPPIERGEALAIAWEDIAGDPRAGELLDLQLGPDGQLHALGMRKPSDPNGRAGSYLARIATSSVDPVAISELAAGPLVATAGGLLVTGSSWSADKRSAAVIRRVDARGGEHWRFVLDEPRYDVPLAAAALADGFVVAVLQAGFNIDTEPHDIVVLRLSDSGELLARQRIRPAFDRAERATMAVLQDGKVLLAVTAEYSNLDATPLVSRRTGAYVVCGAPARTELLSLDYASLEIQARTVLSGLVVRRFRATPGSVLVLAGVDRRCERKHGVGLYRIAPDLTLTELFTLHAASDLRIADFETRGDSILLAGLMRAARPVEIALSQRNRASESLFDEALFERDERVTSAVLMLVDRSGHVLADRVLHDPRHRNLARVAIAGDEAVAVGGALGDRAWALRVRLGGAPAQPISGGR